MSPKIEFGIPALATLTQCTFSGRARNHHHIGHHGLYLPYDTYITCQSFPHVQMTSFKEKIAVAEPERSDISEKLNRDNFYPVSYTGESGVLFEEYLYYAALQRRAEDGLGPFTAYPLPEKRSWFNKLSDHKGPNVNVDVSHVEDAHAVPTSEAEAERMNAIRALRVTSWISVFYLITTDILGPFNAPFAISQVGWVPGECYT